MTVSEQVPLNEYVGDGAVTTFAFTFTIIDSSDLVVKVDDVLQVENTDYTVENITELGGDVEFSVAPAIDTNISISRDTPLDQQTVYNPFDPFPAKTHEGALDKLTLIVQELNAGSASSDALSRDSTGEFWEGENVLLKNLLSPVDDQDAATRLFVEQFVGSGFDPSSDQTITGLWEFTQLILGTTVGNTRASIEEVISAFWAFAAGIEISQGQYVQGRDNGSNLRNLVGVLGGLSQFGDDTINSEMRYLDNMDVRQSNTAVGAFRSLAQGGIEVRDLLSQRRKSGFRNPGNRDISSDSDTLQADEDAWITLTAGVGQTLNVTTLEQFSVIHVRNIGANPWAIVPDGGITLEFMSGGSVGGGSRTFDIGSVAELIWRTPTTVQIYGNGLT